jgi:tetratricopeptide (TPR) repeat protein
MMELEQMFRDLELKYHELSDRNLERSSMRVAQEIRRLAKSERKLIPYLTGSFRAMVGSSQMLQPGQGRDLAIELISLLESEAAARNFQGDLPMEEYEATVQWMSSCAYDNLATCVASIEGFNSGEMHQCIHEGIQVCRRTGKLQCINCFREYASEVYAASDDLEMAIHFSKVGMEAEPSGAQDRRWCSARSLAELQLQQGDLVAAEQTMGKVLELVDTYHSPKSAAIISWNIQSHIALLFGRAEPPMPDFPPRGESPHKELRLEQLIALRETIAGQWDQAIERLMQSESLLRERKILSEVFRNRLQLLSVLKFCNRLEPMKRLAEELKQWAEPASDHLTLRFVERLLDPNVPAAPYPTLLPLNAGPFSTQPRRSPSTADNAKRSTDGEASVATGDASPDHQAIPDGDATPVNRLPPPAIASWLEKLPTLLQDDSAPLETLVEQHRQLLMKHPLPVETAIDAAWLLHCMALPLADHAEPASKWDWANRLAQTHLGDGACLSLLAFFGHQLQEQGFPTLPVDTLQSMFQTSLKLVPDGARSFFRAGLFFMGIGKTGEAERCLARAFRLSRDDHGVANTLAELYAGTERELDGLEVLDMCIRAGCADPATLLRAAQLAQMFNRHEEALLYLDRLESVTSGGILLGDVLRASSQLELERYEEAGDTIANCVDMAEQDDGEEGTGPNPQLLILMATAAAGTKSSSLVAEMISNLAQFPMSVFSEFPVGHTSMMFNRLWKVLSNQLPEHPMLPELETILFESCIVPPALFEVQRSVAAEKESDDLKYYAISLHQPLDDDWYLFRGCWSHQSEWVSYRVTWGVLALSEPQAVQIALANQSRCYPKAAEVESVQMLHDGITEYPGVIWQGQREGELPDDPQ